MEEFDSQPEEGEVISDIEDGYTPLERPSNNSTTAQPTIIPTHSSDEDEASASSNSDSDVETHRKEPKPKLPPPPKKIAPRKNNIWCDTAQEDVLLQNLVNCDVSNVDRTRTVESYTNLNWKRKRPYNNSEYSFDGAKPTNNSKGKRRKIEERILLDLHYTVDDSEEDIARDIANKLSEEKEHLIRSVVQVAGKEKAIELFKQTQEIEKGGGMMILSYSRRRTPGGVFFFLVKSDADLSTEQQEEIFTEDRQKYKEEARSRKRIKYKHLKETIKARHAKHLPQLLPRSELELSNSFKKEELDVEEDIKNPPPSPDTDGLDNITDGTENYNASEGIASRSAVDYDDDFLDIQDMDCVL